MSPPRKFSGKVKPGMGVDGTEGESFTRKSQDPWTQESNYKEKPNYPGKYSVNESGLRNKMPDEDPQQGNTRRGGGTDIWNEVEGQSSDDGNRAVKSRGND